MDETNIEIGKVILSNSVKSIEERKLNKLNNKKPEKSSHHFTLNDIKFVLTCSTKVIVPRFNFEAQILDNKQENSSQIQHPIRPFSFVKPLIKTFKLQIDNVSWYNYALISTSNCFSLFNISSSIKLFNINKPFRSMYFPSEITAFDVSQISQNVLVGLCNGFIRIVNIFNSTILEEFNTNKNLDSTFATDIQWVSNCTFHFIIAFKSGRLIVFHQYYPLNEIIDNKILSSPQMIYQLTDKHENISFYRNEHHFNLSFSKDLNCNPIEISFMTSSLVCSDNHNDNTSLRSDSVAVYKDNKTKRKFFFKSWTSNQRNSNKNGIFNGHYTVIAQINRIAINPVYSHLIAVACEDSFIRLIDQRIKLVECGDVDVKNDKSCYCLLSNFGSFVCLKWSDDGHHLIGGCQDDMVYFWCVNNNGKNGLEIKLKYLLGGHISWPSEIQIDRINDKSTKNGLIPNYSTKSPCHYCPNSNISFNSNNTNNDNVLSSTKNSSVSSINHHQTNSYQTGNLKKQVKSSFVSSLTDIHTFPKYGKTYPDINNEKNAQSKNTIYKYSILSLGNDGMLLNWMVDCCCSSSDSPNPIQSTDNHNFLNLKTTTPTNQIKLSDDRPCSFVYTFDHSIIIMYIDGLCQIWNFDH